MMVMILQMEIITKLTDHPLLHLHQVTSTMAAGKVQAFSKQTHLSQTVLRCSLMRLGESAWRNKT